MACWTRRSEFRGLDDLLANSSSSDVCPSPLGEKEFKMRELIERIASLKEADVYSITDFSKAENPSGDAQALAARIRKEIEKHMPPGAVLKCEVVRYLGRKSIHVTTALEKDLSKVANRIRDNDRALQTFYVDGVNDDDTLKDKLTATISRGGSLTVKPEPGSYYAFGHVKFGWRKKSGTPDQIVKHFGDYFKKVKKVIQDNKDMMPEGIETGTMRGLIEKSIERLEGTGKGMARAEFEFEEDADLEENKMYRSSSEIAKDLKDVPWVKELDSESAPKVVSYLSSKWTDPLQVAVYMAKDDAERKKKISTLKSVKGTAANKFLNALRMIETKYGQKDE